MTALEIVLLLIGIICVAVSFIFFVKIDGPEKAQSVNLSLSDRQKEDIQNQIAAVFKEQTVQMSQNVEDRTRDALERLSNEKIKELSEYSDTVLSEINRNHTEAMFLYDMLNEKNKEVHNNIRDIQRAVESTRNNVKAGQQEMKAERNQKPSASEHTVTAGQASGLSKDASVHKNGTGKEMPKTTPHTDSPLDENMDAGDDKRAAVLSLYRQGKTEVEIAKTLGIGVGEVKLVIDLFKGIK